MSDELRAAATKQIDAAMAKLDRRDTPRNGVTISMEFEDIDFAWRTLVAARIALGPCERCKAQPAAAPVTTPSEAEREARDVFDAVNEFERTLLAEIGDGNMDVQVASRTAKLKLIAAIEVLAALPQPTREATAIRQLLDDLEDSAAQGAHYFMNNKKDEYEACLEESRTTKLEILAALGASTRTKEGSEREPAKDPLT